MRFACKWGRSNSSRPAEGASRHLASGRPGRASSCRPPSSSFPLRRSREGGGGGCPTTVGPVRVARQPALRSVSSRSARSSRAAAARVRRGRRALTEGGGRGQGGRWDRGVPGAAPPGSRPCRPPRSAPRPWRPARSGSRRRST